MKTVMRLASAVAGLMLLSFAAGNSLAADLQPSNGPVVLTVDGNIQNRNQGDAAVFSLADLSAMPQHSLEMETPWTEGEHVFSGVLLRDLLDRVGARGKSIAATALNDYRSEIPVEDAYEHDVILALTRDGEFMSVRDKGPVWVLYPDAAALPNEFRRRMIWQLKEIEIQ